MEALDSIVARVQFNTEAQAVEVVCKDYHTNLQILDILDQTETVSTEMRKALEKTLEMVKNHGCTTWIGDLSTLLLLTGDDERWSLQDWLPRLKNAGIRNIALVPPSSVLGSLFFDSIIQQSTGITIRKLHSLEAAQTWAKQQLN
jgi:hypothetical protein